MAAPFQNRVWAVKVRDLCIILHKSWERIEVRRLYQGFSSLEQFKPLSWSFRGCYGGKRYQIATADVTPVDSTVQYLVRKMKNACFHTEIFYSASNTKEYRNCTVGTTENFVPKTFKLKKGGASKLSIPIHVCTGPRNPGGSGSHNFWTIGTWRQQGCQPYTPATFTPPWDTPVTHFCFRFSRLPGQ